MARDQAYARDVEAAIRRGCGLKPDFSDCRAPAPARGPRGDDAGAVKRATKVTETLSGLVGGAALSRAVRKT